MTKRIYDFLPSHLKNQNLETIFESTIERAFSDGEVEKLRGFVGRKEGGIYKFDDAYVTYPTYNYDRRNYALEPVFSNDSINDRIFYNDLINAMYNKGALINDHHRLFTEKHETINIPIDKDKFANWVMYYWVLPGFDPSIPGSEYKTYITMDRAGSNWWSDNNSWYHHNDINHLINESNSDLIIQAKRPIIEFDGRMQLSTQSLNKIDNGFELPLFEIYDLESNVVGISTVFEYTGDEEFAAFDDELQLRPKLTAGDYQSEYTFNIPLTPNNFIRVDGVNYKITIPCEFKFRKIREQFDNAEEKTELPLHFTPNSINDIDVYINGVKQFGNYSLNGDTVVLDFPTREYVYVDLYTEDTITNINEDHYQLLPPSIEFNIDNQTYVGVDLPYSIVFDHFVNIIDVIPGLTGEPNGNNNYRTLGDPANKIRYNNQGNVMITHEVDIRQGYFYLTRNDYNPIEAFEFLSHAYNDYKNKVITLTRKLLEDPANQYKTATEILEEVLHQISISRSTVLKQFEGVDMLVFGSEFVHYEKGIISVVDGIQEQLLPSMANDVVEDKDLFVYVNGALKMLNIDYIVSATGNEIIFSPDYVPSSSDTIEVRLYTNKPESYMPPSATRLELAPLYIPRIVYDNEYDTPVNFILGHDGSKVPMFNDLTDDVLLEFERRIFNNVSSLENGAITYQPFTNFGLSNPEYSVFERNYIMYPFFKKWMDKNNIDALVNANYDPDDWKTWNYSNFTQIGVGHWRGIHLFLYGTDTIFDNPWAVLGLANKPSDFDTNFGSDYTSESFWIALTDYIATEYTAQLPIPVTSSNELKSIQELLNLDIDVTRDSIYLSDNWKFGDCSPIEMAWIRSSEYPYQAFNSMILQQPFSTFETYENAVKEAISFFSTRNGYDVNARTQELENYEFKLGTRFAGFVNNFKLFSENTSLNNSRYSEIPSDNYDIFLHAGEPNRSEFFSAVVLEKVSLDTEYPTYDIANVGDYNKGMIVLNPSDGKYYKRRVESPTQAEIDMSLTFDYTAWVMISQPQVSTVGYRLYGYDDANPRFYALDWDTASGIKVYATEGEQADLKPWSETTYYRKDEVIQYNNKPYVCLETHTSGRDFGDDAGNWKMLGEWPRINKITVTGYNNLRTDSVTTYNYGDILTLQQVAHLLIGYQEYSKLIGWDFTDRDADGNLIDFEYLLKKFLDWSEQQHDMGEFISLTPMLSTGSFTTPFGVASATRDYRQGFYRVVDQNGSRISLNQIQFLTTDGELSWASNTPIYGMAMDIIEIEHAMVIDREDSYGDVIYDPLMHNRNLRVLIDCNRTVGWDGTMTADGYIISEQKLIPNFETLVADTEKYRDTILDQNLEIINNLKASHMGYVPSTYLLNHGVEPESQMEFYKGFIAHKGTNQSVNLLVNKNSNIDEVEHGDVWAIKEAEYGVNDARQVVSVSVDPKNMVSEPLVVTFDNTEYPMVQTGKRSTASVKTSGYVDDRYVDYKVFTQQQLEDLSSDDIDEGDLAWVQFDQVRDWDVVRLSEIAEIGFVGETQDGQLYVILTNKVNTSEPVYLRIVDNGIEPEINSYYYLVEDGVVSSGYKYLVFETNYEPLTVEIDSTTSNSILSPSTEGTGVEAIGSVSFPIFAEGDNLYINGTPVTYTESNAQVQILIEGSRTIPFVKKNDQISIAVRNESGSLLNSTTNITFDGLTVTSVGAFAPSVGESFQIDGVTITIQPASISSIRLTSTATETTNVPNNRTITIDGTTVTVGPVIATATNIPADFTTTQQITINGNVITYDIADYAPANVITPQDIADGINAAGFAVSASINGGGYLVVESDGAYLEMLGSIVGSTGFGFTSSSLYRRTKFEDIASDITSSVTNVTSYTDSSNRLVIESGNPTMTISGNALTILGITAGTYNTIQEPTRSSVVNQINSASITGVTASVVSGNYIEIYKEGPKIQLSNVNTGTLESLGFTGDIEKYGYEQIVENINAVFSNNTAIAEAYFNTSTGVINIVSPNAQVDVTNVSGSALTDLGISPGIYTPPVGGGIVDAYVMRDLINAAGVGVSVSVSSDGRMIFTSDDIAITFDGTSQQILDSIGLVRDYTSAKSDPNFKIMRWKSVRFTPGYNGVNFNEFYTNLGLNSSSYIWADNYTTNRWAVLFRTEEGNVTTVALQSERVDTDLVKRVVTTDGTGNIQRYHIYDPLNGKFQGEIGKHIKFITWEDPAKYEYETSNKDTWYEEHVGEIWWDTNLVRYYRYNDYGDRLGNIDQSFARRNWGRLVPGSQIVIKRWSSATILPDYVTDYNEYTYFDIVKGKTITKYYFWEAFEEDTGNIRVDDIRRMLVNNDTSYKFFPIDGNTIVLTNHKNDFTGDSSVKYDLHYDLVDVKGGLHTEWRLISELLDNAETDVIIDIVKNNLANIEIVDSVAVEMSQGDIDNGFDGIEFTYDFITSADYDTLVITVNNAIVEPNNFVIDGDMVTLNYSSDYVAGDVVRIYKVKPLENNFFYDPFIARRNFASLFDDMFKFTFIDRFAPTRENYITVEDSIFYLKPWAITEEFIEPPKYQYLSRLRSFDMIDLYNQGVISFKVQEDGIDEYFVEFNGNLQIVHRTDSAMGIDFDRAPSGNPQSYYENFTGIQLLEFFTMMEYYATHDMLKEMAIEMINYRMTEEQEATDIVKTSYIDLIFNYRPLAQHAVYQRDSYQDMIDYFNETKPYHVKIRDIESKYTLQDDITASIDDSHHMDIDMYYGWYEVADFVIEEEYTASNPYVIENFMSYFEKSSLVGHEIDIYVEEEHRDYEVHRVEETFVSDGSATISIAANSNVVTQVKIKSGQETTLVLDRDYTVDYNAHTITFVTAPAIDDEITVTRSYEVTQINTIESQYQNDGVSIRHMYKLRPEYYKIVGDDIIFNTEGVREEDMPFDGSYNGKSFLPEIGEHVQLVLRESRYEEYRVDGNADFDTDNEHEGGSLLRVIDEYTSEADGLPEGMMPTHIKESVFNTISDSGSGDILEFQVYDNWGRAFRMIVNGVTTVTDFTGDKLTVADGSIFRNASEQDRVIIAINNGTHTEFMSYKTLDGNVLTINKRAEFTNLYREIASGDTVYVFRDDYNFPQSKSGLTGITLTSNVPSSGSSSSSMDDLQGYLAYVWAVSPSSDVADPTDTNHPNYDIDFKPILDRNINHVWLYDKAPPLPARVDQTGTTTIDIDPDWIYLIGGRNANWTGDEHRIDYEFLDSNDNVVGAARQMFSATFKSRIYHGPDLANLVHSGDTGTYPNVNGYWFIENDALYFRTVPDGNNAYQYDFIQQFSSTPTKLRISNAYAESNYSTTGGAYGSLRIQNAEANQVITQQEDWWVTLDDYASYNTSQYSTDGTVLSINDNGSPSALTLLFNEDRYITYAEVEFRVTNDGIGDAGSLSLNGFLGLNPMRERLVDSQQRPRINGKFVGSKVVIGQWMKLVARRIDSTHMELILKNADTGNIVDLWIDEVSLVPSDRINFSNGDGSSYSGLMETEYRNLVIRYYTI